MTKHALGTFDVKLTPLPAQQGIAQMAIDKQFRGQLEARSTGQMLTATTAVKGSAGYVAIEHLTGTLNGHKGGFTLQHSGAMSKATQHLSITIVPDSGTEELTGITGTMSIRLEEGQHFYDLEYTLP